MIYTPLTVKAIKLAFEKHEGQTDKAGLPYVLHPIHLAESMTDEISTVAAVLHDVIEDTDCTFAQLEEMGFPEESIDAIRLLTHDENEPYLEYVRRIGANPVARKVKLADLKHNSDLTRIPNVTQRDLERVEKYRKAMAILMEKEGEQR